MCLAIYIGSGYPLPLIPWWAEAPAFHVVELPEKAQSVRSHFSVPNVYYVGTHEGCGCPFNYGRECPAEENEPNDLAKAIEMQTRLASYASENSVSQIYACWFDDEHLPQEHYRQITPNQLGEIDFVFRERELFNLADSTT